MAGCISYTHTYTPHVVCAFPPPNPGGGPATDPPHREWGDEAFVTSKATECRTQLWLGVHTRSPEPTHKVQLLWWWETTWKDTHRQRCPEPHYCGPQQSAFPSQGPGCMQAALGDRPQPAGLTPRKAGMSCPTNLPRSGFLGQLEAWSHQVGGLLATVTRACWPQSQEQYSWPFASCSLSCSRKNTLGEHLIALHWG